MGILTQSALANETITFSKSVSDKIASDFQFCLDVQDANSKTIDILNLKTEKYYTLSEEYKHKTELLTQDKLDLKIRGDKLEEVAKTCSNDLGKCKDNQVSRIEWWGYGVLSAVILGTISAFAFKK